MTGKVIISLDCEGKWGMADRAAASLAFIDNARLLDAYRRILDIFDKFRAKATFGFVAALCLEPELLRSELDEVAHLSYRGRNWLSLAQSAIRAGDFEGWAQPRLVHEVTARGGHHICTHSGTHIPYSDSDTSAESVAWDLDFARRMHSAKGLEWGQIIFPRNVVGHLRAVAQAGVTAYRDVDPQERKSGRAGKLTRLFHEFANLDAGNLMVRPPLALGGPIPLSGAKFLSARIGIRRYIPVPATLRRIEVLLKFAARKGATAHFYTHPHNFLRDPSVFVKLEHLLRTASNLGSSNGLEICTMKEEENALRSAAQIHG